MSSKINNPIDSSTKGDNEKKWKVIDTPQDCSLIPTIGVTVWMGWNAGLIFLQLYGIFLANTTQRTIILAVFITSLILPSSFPGKLGYEIGDWTMRCAMKYFGMKITFEDEDAIISLGENTNKGAIFPVEPHHVLPFNVFIFNQSLQNIPGRIGSTGTALLTGAVFKLPIMRNIYTWIGAFSVDKKTFAGRLSRGESVAFVPGGVQEVIMLDPDKPNDLICYLKNRKGFVKLALQYGSPIIPVFCFHLEPSFGFMLPPGKRFVNLLSRKIGFCPLLFWGRWKIPFGIPRPQKLHCVIGKVIDVPCEGDNVSKESIEKYHALYLKRLVELFERHKDKEGYGEKTLTIM